MSPIITLFLLLFITLYVFVILVELITTKLFKRFLIEFILLIIFVLILNLVTGFPVKTAPQPFGGISPLLAIGIMFVCSILGIMANYFFYLDVKFSWNKFLKPFLVAPIVFLPLVGSVQGVAHLESMQMISFAILAFQSGFFWQKIFEKNHE